MLKTLMFVFTSILFSVASASAAPPDETTFDNGQWFRASLEIDAVHEIPFFLWLPKDDSDDAIIRNGAEDITVDFDRTDTGIILDFPHYDSRVVAQMDGDEYYGKWRKMRREGAAIMWFSASPIRDLSQMKQLFWAPRKTPRNRHLQLFFRPDPKPIAIAPRWKMAFAESGVAIGRFNGLEGILQTAFQGTIETTTGDYRYLSGAGWDSTLKLSVFDGAHAFLFDATIDEAGRHMTGDFYSGNWWHEPFVATRIEEGDDYQLPDPFSEVALESGDGKLHIEQLDHPRYIGKPVIVQIFGTWCPNCHEEAPTLVDLYNSYHEQGLEMLGLAYEVTGDDERSRRQVERFIEKYSIPWQIVIAGTSDKEQASQTLPDISEVKSFPTTIWIGRDGKVRAIHSGFSGAATGDVHTKLLAEFDRLTREITK